MVLPIDGSRGLPKRNVLNIGDNGPSPCVSFDDNSVEQLGAGIPQSV